MCLHLTLWGFRELRGLGPRGRMQQAPPAPAPALRAAGLWDAEGDSADNRGAPSTLRSGFPPADAAFPLRAPPGADHPPLPLTRATCLCLANPPTHDPTSQGRRPPPSLRPRGPERGAYGVCTALGENPAPFKPQARSAPFRGDSQGLGTGVLPQSLSPVRRCQGLKNSLCPFS